jgi:hypothetical protein
MISPEFLFDKGLTPTTYYYLYCLYLGVEFPWIISKDLESKIVSELIAGSWIDIELNLRPKTTMLFEGNTVDAFNEFAEKYLALWPTQKEANSRRMLRASLVDCTNKFKRWFKKYKVESNSENYDIILAVTKKYLTDQAREGYRYCMKANYFIEKDGESALYPYFSEYSESDSSDDTSFVKLI